ncbi:MAG: hypothetical protein MUC56_01980 [Thermoanaerobaculales bacterium]|jgi:hypothetical protein|nr:hypothetical protein [Thermoanaerobaculales bacterium]
MRPRVVDSCFISAIFIAGAAGATAGESGFDLIIDHYEAVREALIGNTTEGVPEHAEAIAVTAERLAGAFDPVAARVAPEGAAAVEALLPEVTIMAERLASAHGLTGTRDAFAGLTQPLTRWQTLVEGPRPVVVYCPMEKKAWLQPDEAIGNPYAPSMLRCGEVVQR